MGIVILYIFCWEVSCSLFGGGEGVVEIGGEDPFSAVDCARHVTLADCCFPAGLREAFCPTKKPRGEAGRPAPRTPPGWVVAGLGSRLPGLSRSGRQELTFLRPKGKKNYLRGLR